ncbi:hypothetical protein [Burkholderia sp. ABCPW 14]|uniref:hypothetical protein n=1 Tax=Burkholderia sp. ABCPW 14 TaxID=1637860 RepID=UPI0012E3E9EC|nr:hypothetical protein [Burkholderia sp. ABCPW 14]
MSSDLRRRFSVAAASATGPSMRVTEPNGNVWHHLSPPPPAWQETRRKTEDLNHTVLEECRQVPNGDQTQKKSPQVQKASDQ